MKYDVLVVGAGLAGSTAARLLAEKGRRVLVIEQRPQVGGNCLDFINESGIMVHQYGPHIFHTNNKPVWDFVQRFSAFNHFQHTVLSFAEGRYLPFPINRDTICSVFGVTISVSEVRAFLDAEVKKSTFNNPPKNFRDAVVAQVGEKLYDLFFKNYTIKQWEKDPEELSAEIASRIPVRENRDPRYFNDKYQGIPEHGYTAMIKNMLTHPAITVLCNTAYEEIKDEVQWQQTVYTGKLDVFFDCKYGKLEYRSVIFDFETKNVEIYQPAAVVNYPNDYDFTRITEFKHFTFGKQPVTTICREFPSAEGEPCYVVMSDENLSKRERYLADSGRLEESGAFTFIGRLAEYKYYNMDQVIESVMRKISQNFG